MTIRYHTYPQVCARIRNKRDILAQPPNRPPRSEVDTGLLHGVRGYYWDIDVCDRDSPKLRAGEDESPLLYFLLCHILYGTRTSQLPIMMELAKRAYLGRLLGWVSCNWLLHELHGILTGSRLLRPVGIRARGRGDVRDQGRKRKGPVSCLRGLPGGF